MAKFKGIECIDKATVDAVVSSEKIIIVGDLEQQVYLLSEILRLFISGNLNEIDPANADLWLKWNNCNALINDADKFIKDNDLK